MSTNQRLAEQLSEIAKLLEVTGANSFRANANSRAARAIEDMTEDIATYADDREALLEIDGIGAKIADKIIEFIKTGKIEEREQLLREVPAGVLEVLRTPGVGPKTARALWQGKGVESIADLKRIIDDGSILEVPRMGKKTVENIKKALEFAEASGGRTPLGVAAPLAVEFAERMQKVKGVERVGVAGSLRRGRDTIGDIDILVATKDGETAGEAFRSMPEVMQVLAAGATKSSVRVSLEGPIKAETRGKSDEETKAPPAVATMQVDLRVVAPESFGAALLYFTGSKEHNIRLRERALKRELTLNEYGLFPLDDEKSPPQSRGVKPVAAATEEEIYEKLELPWIPPELREDRGEMDLTPEDPPALITLEDIRAELHAHTTASDGAMSIEELARAAKELGFHTIAVTDHSKSQTIANGLSKDRLLKHIDAIREADETVKGIRILAGSEVDILADGKLDYDDATLEKLDIVVASPHWALKQDPKAATERLLRAVRHPLVHILGHATGRLVGRREGLAPDIGAIAEAAAECGTALEINAHWMRLDLRDIHVRTALEAGATIAINCDVHGMGDFDNLRYGVTTGRRGWLTADRCVNSWSAKKLHGWLKSKRESASTA
ncbi:MAG: DNA polymerase/3'-5' exonuclease PolX [Phycisphaeraceae bacterium]|nr:MAG: DNA polymerase/3'-5' exonuclease PolX [Phycisphaeraceae bacterium]